MPTASATGRPRRSSRETLQEAAYELFLERGYADVSVEDIARRAGVSRSTFWAYASAKSDLLWFDVDAALGALESRLTRAGASSRAEVRSVVAEIAAGFGPGDVPLPMVDSSAMKLGDELRASAYPRLARLVDILGVALGESVSGGRPGAWAEAARIVAACEQWVLARPRGLLGELLDGPATRP
jgi:AcrR family transcriptional regulator